MDNSGPPGVESEADLTFTTFVKVLIWGTVGAILRNAWGTALEVARVVLPSGDNAVP